MQVDDATSQIGVSPEQALTSSAEHSTQVTASRSQTGLPASRPAHEMPEQSTQTPSSEQKGAEGSPHDALPRTPSAGSHSGDDVVAPLLEVTPPVELSVVESVVGDPVVVVDTPVVVTSGSSMQIFEAQIRPESQVWSSRHSHSRVPGSHEEVSLAPLPVVVSPAPPVQPRAKTANARVEARATSE